MCAPLSPVVSTVGGDSMYRDSVSCSPIVSEIDSFPSVLHADDCLSGSSTASTCSVSASLAQEKSPSYSVPFTPPVPCPLGQYLRENNSSSANVEIPTCIPALRDVVVPPCPCLSPDIPFVERMVFCKRPLSHLTLIKLNSPPARHVFLADTRASATPPQQKRLKKHNAMQYSPTPSHVQNCPLLYVQTDIQRPHFLEHTPMCQADSWRRFKEEQLRLCRSDDESVLGQEPNANAHSSLKQDGLLIKKDMEEETDFMKQLGVFGAKSKHGAVKRLNSSVHRGFGKKPPAKRAYSGMKPLFFGSWAWPESLPAALPNPKKEKKNDACSTTDSESLASLSLKEPAPEVPAVPAKKPRLVGGRFAGNMANKKRGPGSGKGRNKLCLCEALKFPVNHSTRFVAAPKPPKDKN